MGKINAITALLLIVGGFLLTAIIGLVLAVVAVTSPFIMIYFICKLFFTKKKRNKEKVGQLTDFDKTLAMFRKRFVKKELENVSQN